MRILFNLGCILIFILICQITIYFSLILIISFRLFSEFIFLFDEIDLILQTCWLRLWPSIIDYLRMQNLRSAGKVKMPVLLYGSGAIKIDRFVVNGWH